MLAAWVAAPCLPIFLQLDPEPVASMAASKQCSGPLQRKQLLVSLKGHLLPQTTLQTAAQSVLFSITVFLFIFFKATVELLIENRIWLHFKLHRQATLKDAFELGRTH